MTAKVLHKRTNGHGAFFYRKQQTRRRAIKFTLFLLELPMQKICCVLLVVVSIISVVRAEEPKKVGQESPEDIVTAGIKQFRDRMRSDDVNVREKEFDEVMPDKKLLERLFGDDANLGRRSRFSLAISDNCY